MDENKSKRTDLDISDDFDRLFNEIQEPHTDDEVRAYLLETGYDFEKLKAEGRAFVNDLMAGNWRFVDSNKVDEAAREIEAVPVRKGWNRLQLTTAIEKLSAALAMGGAEPHFAFRNLDELTETDLATILQELEYKAHMNGIGLDLD